MKHVKPLSIVVMLLGCFTLYSHFFLLKKDSSISFAPLLQESSRLSNASYNGRRNLSVCSLCTHSKQCSLGTCWNHRCIQGTTFDDLEASKKECSKYLKPYCSSCTASSQCKFGKCYWGKCLPELNSPKYWTERKRCFPNSGECARCTVPRYTNRVQFRKFSSQCGKGLSCKHNRCIVGTPTTAAKASFDKCFNNLLDTCTKCSANSHCKSFRCMNGRCIPKGAGIEYKAATKKCMPNLQMCSICTRSSQCRSKYCYHGRCFKKAAGMKNIDGKMKCFTNLKKNCEKCISDLSCTSKKCFRGRCVRAVSEEQLEVEVKKCADNLRECGRCTKSIECGGVGKCFQKRCLHGKSEKKFKESFIKCFKKRSETCQECSVGYYCKSLRCFFRRCMPNAKDEFEVARNSCTPNLKECSRCTNDPQCGKKHICKHNRCVVRAPKTAAKASFDKCFKDLLDSCAQCSANSHCKSFRCMNGRCMPKGNGIEYKTAIKNCLPNLQLCSLCTRSNQCNSKYHCFFNRCIRFGDQKQMEAEREKCGKHLLKKLIKKRGFRECAACTFQFDCESGLCQKGKCIFKKEVENSVLRCRGVAPICARCGENNHCASGLCSFGVCIPKGVSFYPRKTRSSTCFMKHIPCAPCGTCLYGSICMANTCIRKQMLNVDIKQCLTGRTQCLSCEKNSECARGLVCYEKRCVPTNSKDSSLNQCYGKGESCDDCLKDEDCANSMCEGGKCSPCSDMKKFPECSRCWETKDCGQDLSCVNGVCFRKNDLDSSEKKCFLSLRECDLCAYDYECTDERLSCVYGKCITATGTDVAASVERCFGNSEARNGKESSGGVECKVKTASISAIKEA